MKGTSAPLAEFIGTFFLCFAGIAAILGTTSAIGSGAGLVGIALAHGLALSVAVNAFGGVSGRALQPGGHRRHAGDGPDHGAQCGRLRRQPAGGCDRSRRGLQAVLPGLVVAEANLGIPLPAAWVTPASSSAWRSSSPSCS